MLDCSLIALEAELYLQVMDMVQGMKESHWEYTSYCIKILTFASCRNINILTRIEIFIEAYKVLQRHIS